MDGGFQFIDIILFALVAGFLILRLRSVLGRRDGHQGPAQDPLRTPPHREPSEDKIVRLPERTDRPSATGQPGAEPAGGEAPRNPVEAGLAQIRTADPRFNPEAFLTGAKIAFETILTAYAAGDTDTLKALLSPEVFANFSQSIRKREQAGERMETTLVGIDSADIVEAYMAGRTAHLTAKIVSRQITVVRNTSNEIVEGHPNSSTEVTDFWTFARDTRSADPNWTLVATGSLE